MTIVLSVLSSRFALAGIANSSLVDSPFPGRPLPLLPLVDGVDFVSDCVAGVDLELFAFIFVACGLSIEASESEERSEVSSDEESCDDVSFAAFSRFRL